MKRFKLFQTTENCGKKHSFVRNARLWYSAVALLLVLAGIGSYAWYSTRVHYIRQSLQLSKAELQVAVYNSQGENVHGINSNLSTDSKYNDHLNTQTTVINGGSELSFDSYGNGTATFYAQATNTGDMDLDLYMQVILNGSNYYERIGDYIHSCVVDITEEIGNETLEGYIADNSLHGAEYLESITDKTTVRYEGTKLTDLQDLKYLAELPNSAADGRTHYYRIELWNNGWPTNVSSQQLDFAFMLYGKQAGMPIGSGTSTDVYTVTNDNEFNDALSSAADGSTILVSADMVISNAVTFNNAVNLCINGCTLRVKSDLNYDFSTQADCSISLIGNGALIIDGNLNIDAPSSNFTISGSGAGSTVKLGTGIAGGNLYVNAALYPTDSSKGFRLANVSVQKKTLLQTYEAAELAVDSQTNVIVSNNTTIGTIRAMEGASNIYAYIYGTAEGAVDLREMAENTPSYTERSYPVSSGYAPNGLDQIYIYVYGSVLPAGNGYRFYLPDWAKSSQNETTPTVGNSNTRIYYDVHTGINDVSGYVNPVNYTGTFVSSNIEIEAYTQNTVVRMNPYGTDYTFNDGEYTNAYRVAIVNYACNNDLWVNGINLSGLGNGSFIMQQILANYFLTAENDPQFAHNVNELREAIAAIDYIEIVSVQPQGGAPETIKAQDLYYISGNAAGSTNAAYEYPMSGISAINLANASVPDNSLPAGSMKNCRARTIKLPSDLAAIESDAFDNAGFFEISIPATVTSIAAGAFDISADNGASGYLFATLEHDGELTSGIMQGFNDSGDKQFVFVKTAINNVFHSHFTFSKSGTINEANYNGISRNWYYKVYETAALSENSVDSSNVRTIRLTRKTVSGVETALLLLSDKSGYDVINTNAEYVKLFPETIDGRPVTGVGDRAFSHLGITGFTVKLDFSDSAGELDLSRYEHIGAEVFKQKNGGGITIPALRLGGISEIGDYAFFKAKIITSSERPTDFKGMTELGEYAFYGCTVGTAPASQVAASAFHSGINGALDLSLQRDKNITAGDYVLAAASFYGCTVKLTNSELINDTVFSGTSFYTCYLDISGAGTVKAAALKDRTRSAVGAYTIAATDLMATDIPMLEHESLQGNWRSVTIGLQSAALRAANAADGSGFFWKCLFSSGTTITALTVDGDIPADCDRPLGMKNNVTNNYGSVTFTENCTTAIPDKFAYPCDLRYSSVKLGVLSIAETVPAIGDYAFYYCYNISTPEGALDLSGKDIGAYAFSNAQMPGVTELNITGCSIGAYAFKSISAANLTALNITGCSGIGAYAFNAANMPGLTSLNVAVSDASCGSIGTYAFKSMTINAAATGGLTIENCGGFSVEDYAFNGCKAITGISLGTGSAQCSDVTFGNYAFQNCTRITGGCFDGLVSAGTYCFSGCTGLKQFKSTTLETTGTYCFSGCTGLAYVNCPVLANFSSDWPYTFTGCTSLLVAETSYNFAYPQLVSLFGGCQNNLRAWIIRNPGAGEAVLKLRNATYNTIFGNTGEKVVTDIFHVVISSEKAAQVSGRDSACVIGTETGEYYWTDEPDGSGSTVTHFATRDGSTEMNVYGCGDYLYEIADGNARLLACFADSIAGAYTVPVALDSLPVSALADYAYCRVPFTAGNVGGITVPASVTVPESFTVLSNYCFMGCTGIRIFTANGITSAPANSFKDLTGLTEVNMSALTAAGNYCFSGCTALTTVNLPALTIAGNYGFSGCTRLAKFENDTLTEVGWNCFANCTGLVYVRCPELARFNFEPPGAGTYWVTRTFMGCTSLRIAETSFDFATPNLASMFKSCPIRAWIIHDPKATGTLSCAADNNSDVYSLLGGGGNWSAFRIIISSEYTGKFSSYGSACVVGTATAGNYFWADDPDGSGSILTHFATKDGTKRMSACGCGDYLYEIADGTAKLVTCFADTIAGDYTAPATLGGRTVTGLGDSAYRRVSFTANTVEDGDGAVTATIPATLTLPGSITAAGDYCFYQCTGLTGITADGLTTAGNYCLSGCTELTTVSLPALTTAGNYCLSGCTELTTVNLPALTTAGNYCLSGCTGLAKFENAALQSVGCYCFKDCTSLVYVRCPKLARFNYAKVGSYYIAATFSGCTSLRIAETSYDFATTYLPSVFKGCPIRAWIIHDPSGTGTLDCQTGSSSEYYNLFGSGTTSGSFSGFRIIISSEYTGRFINYGSVGIAGTATTGNYFWADDPDGSSSVLTHFATKDGTKRMSACGCGDYLYEIADGRARLIACFADEIKGAYTAPATLGGRTVTGLSDSAYRRVSFAANTVEDGDGAVTATIPATLTLPGSITAAGDYCFYQCTGLTGITAGGLTTAGNYCLSGCTELTTVNLPALITAGKYCFSGCTGLTKFENTTLKSVGCYCFSGCSALVYVRCPVLREFGNDGASGYENYGTFMGCTALRIAETSYDFSKTRLATLFRSCTASLRAWIIHDPGPGATSLNCSIGNNNWYNMFYAGTNVSDSFRFIVSRSRGSDIDYSKLITATGSGKVVPADSTGSFFWADAPDDGTVTHFTATDGTTRMSVYGCGDYLYELVDGRARLVACFAGNITGDYTAPAALPYGSGTTPVTGLANYAFFGVTFTDANVTLPDSIATIGSNSFLNCGGVKGFTANGLTAVSTGCFVGSGVQSITANAMTALQNDCFKDLTSLTAFSAASITTLGNNCFRGCTGLTTVNLPALTTAGTYCFSGCGFRVFENATLETTGVYCFYNCKELAYVNCPKLKEFGGVYAHTFDNCTRLRVAETSYSFSSEYFRGVFMHAQNSVRAWIIHDPGPGERTLDCQTGCNSDNTMFEGGLTIPASFRIIVAQSSTSSVNYAGKITKTGKAKVISTASTGNFFWADAPDDGTVAHFTAADGTTPMSIYGCGDYLYEIVDGEATLVACFADDITGDYSVPATLPNGTGTATVTVTGLSSYAFLGVTFTDANVTLLDSFSAIGTGVFTGTELNAFTANALTTLPDRFFQDCKKLATVSLPALTTAGSYCFSGCTGLTKFESSALTAAGTYCFSDCTSLVYVRCPQLAEFGGSEAHTFSGCTKLRIAETSYRFNYGKLPGFFDNCTALRAWIIRNPGNPGGTEVTLNCGSGGTTSIMGYNKGATAIFRIVVPQSFAEKINGYGSAAVCGCVTDGTGFFWTDEPAGSGNAVTPFCDADGIDMSIYGYGDYLCEVTDTSGHASILACFEDSTGSTYTVPAVLAEYDITALAGSSYYNVAFSGDSSIMIPEGVTTVGNSAFASANVFSISLPATLTALGTNTFSGSSIRNIYLMTDPDHTGTADRVTATALFGSSAPADVKVYMDRNAYENVYTDAWGGIPRVQFVASEYIVTIDGVTFYLDEYGNGYIVSTVANGGDKAAISFPESYTNDDGTKNVIAIGSGALETLKNSTTVTSFKLPRTLRDFYVDYTLIPESLAEYTMEGGIGTKYSTIDGVLYTRDGSAIISYPRGKAETEFTVPESVSYVAAGAFTDCTGLETVNVNTPLSFAGNAVKNCSQLAALNLPGDGFCRFLGKDTFTGTRGNFRIYVPSGTAEQYMKYVYCDDAAVKLLTERAALAADWDFTVLNDTDVRLVRSLAEIPAADENGVITLTIPSQVESSDSIIYTVTALSGSLLNGRAYTEINIPDSILDIDMAMFDGSAVRSISVADENPIYCAYNGMLLSKNRSTLYRLMPAVTGDVTLEGVAAVANGALNDTQADSIDMSSVKYTGTNNLSVREKVLEIKSFNPLPAASLGDSMFGNAGSYLAITVADGCAETYKAAAGWRKYAECITEDHDAEAGVPETVYLSEDGWSYRLVTQDDGTAGAELISLDEPAQLMMQASAGTEDPEDDSMTDLLSSTSDDEGQTEETAEEAAKEMMEETEEEMPMMTSLISGNVMLIPNEVDGYAVVGLSADFDTSEVSEFDVETDNPMFSAENGVLFSKDGSVLIRYPAGNASTEYTISDDITVAGYAFKNAVNLETVSMTLSTLRTMGERAFEGCGSLTGIIISDMVSMTMIYNPVPELESAVPAAAENDPESAGQAAEPEEQTINETGLPVKELPAEENSAEETPIEQAPEDKAPADTQSVNDEKEDGDIQEHETETTK